MLTEVKECFTCIAREIAKRERLLIVTPEPEEVERELLHKININNVCFLPCSTNDTWSRDHGAITIWEDNSPVLLDFAFNGWGLKFAFDKDNRITRKAMEAGALKGKYESHLEFVLEGGSIESNGEGTLLTSSKCLLSPHRNGEMNRKEIEEYLFATFQLKQMLWLDYGYLAGDDTDSHIDTLVRFSSPNTLVYVKCSDSEDEHYEALLKMEEQLKSFRLPNGKPFQLLPLPMANKIIEAGERLPATYANFLIMNNAVLYPVYYQPDNDTQAGEVLQTAFPNHKIIGIDCRTLIKQHGSLHCVTMQYPAGVL
jgi:agmatine/peptidylarginine deiminase